MLGIIYLLMCFLTGWLFCRAFFPKLKDKAYIRGSFREKNIRLPRYFVLLPAWYVTGTLIVTWCVYIISCVFEKNIKPMIYGNVLTLGVLAAIFVLVYIFGFSKKRIVIHKKDFFEFFVGDSFGYNVFSLIILAFSIVIMYRTFYFKDNCIHVGLSVWADFGAHLSMIRSFSYGNNFPTQYAYFGGQDIKYHFMHEFLVGNLEYLGLRLDHAFNIPSILSFWSMYMLLFTLSMHLFRKQLSAWIGALLFTFRSSPSALIYLAAQREHPFKALFNNTSYFNYSEYHESWGFWCTRVFCNQRHLAFGISVLLLAILLYLSHFMKLGKKLENYRLEGLVVEDENGAKLVMPRLHNYAYFSFFTKKAFAIKYLRLAIGCGLMLGALAFWHGSMLIAALSILFFMAAFSNYRLDYLITAGIAVAMSFLQSHFFITGSAVKPELYFGFLAENRTGFGVLTYIFMLTGFTILLAIICATRCRGTVRYLLFAFSVPFILSFFLKLTPDIGVNHKWVILSLMFISLYTGHLVAELFDKHDGFTTSFALILIFILTITGVSELSIQAHEDQNSLAFDQNDPVTLWLKENVTADDLCLGDEYALTNIVMGGIINYYSYPYCTWSAGYDTKPREEKVKKIFEASNPVDLHMLTYSEGIDYIIVDVTNRESTSYTMNENNIAATFEEVFTYGEGKWSVRIFDTSKPIYKNKEKNNG